MKSFTLVKPYQDWNVSAWDVQRLLDLSIRWLHREGVAFDAAEARRQAGQPNSANERWQRWLMANEAVGKVILMARAMTGQLDVVDITEVDRSIQADVEEILARIRGQRFSPSDAHRAAHDVRNLAGNDATVYNLAGSIYSGGYPVGRDRSVQHDVEQAMPGPVSTVSAVSTKRLKPSKRKWSLFGGRKVDDTTHAPTAADWQNIATAQKLAVAKMTGQTLV